MDTQKVKEIFVGNGGALSTSYAATTQGQLGVFGNDNTALSAGQTISTSGKDSIFIQTLNAEGGIKKSMQIKGSSVTGFKALPYAPAQKQVYAIGAVRGGAGTIEVANDTIYSANIHFKNDKTWYSVRPENFRIEITSAAAATQSNIADQIVSFINNSAFGKGTTKQIKAVKVGDAAVSETNPLGLVGAVDYGVEIWALDIPQFQNTTYQENKVYFSVQVDDASGFGTTTTVSEVQAFDYGNGTYNQIYNEENFDYGYEGALNRRLFPIPTLSFAASSSGVVSGSIAGITVTGTTATDVIRADAGSFTAAGLVAGSIVGISGNYYEIKYLVSSTVAVLTSDLSTSPAVTAISSRLFYDVIVVEFTDVVTTAGANVGQFAKKALLIATPAINASATTLANPSTEGAALTSILNPWMSSTPLAPNPITL